MSSLDLQKFAQQLRVDSIRCTTAAGSGHPSSSMSAADLMAVLVAQYLRYDFNDSQNPANDHLIFSKGHAAPLLYAIYKGVGAVTDEELLQVRKFGCRLQGHPTPIIPWVDVATGSLGQGLPIAVGIALAGQYLDKIDYKTWVLLGDSEMAEGSVWEAFASAAHYKLRNLIAIIDVNRMGQRGETAVGWNTKIYADRARAFGWHAIEIDGHSLSDIDAAYKQAAQSTDLPTVIIAKTMKGKGVSFVQDQPGWHGKPLNKEQAEQGIKELGGLSSLIVSVQKPEAATIMVEQSSPLQLPQYAKGTLVATRKAYGEALAALGNSNPSIVVLDSEVGNSTYAEDFAHAHPNRFFEMFIAEQQMVATAVGFSVRKRIPFASTFAAFLTRAYDFIRMAAISQGNIKLCGSHAGVSIGEDGPSQMGLEDLAMMRAIYGSTVLYPCDANQAAALTAVMADRQGIVFLRTTREKTPVLYEFGTAFPVGGSVTVRSSDHDQVTVVGAGITLHESLKAFELLAKEGITVRVVDAYSVKPIDGAMLEKAARETKGIIVVEDHWAEGGLGDAVLDGLSNAGVCATVVKLAVRQMPGSGKPMELLDAAGISAAHIVTAVQKFLKS